MSIERIKFRGKLSRDMNNFDASCEITEAGSWMYCSGAADSEAWAKMPTAERYQHLSIPRFFEMVDAGIIDPATVGQWTGLVDSKGVDVYEGDIVEYNDTPSTSVFDPPEVSTYIVMFEGGHFYLSDIDGEVDYDSEININPIVVIGNVHEVTK